MIRITDIILYNCINLKILTSIPFFDFLASLASGVVVKFLAYRTTSTSGPGFNPLSRHYDIRDSLSPESKSRYYWNNVKVT